MTATMYDKAIVATIVEDNSGGDNSGGDNSGGHNSGGQYEQQ